MPKYNVIVVDTVTVTYEAVEIEAENEDTAMRIAEDMRSKGKLIIQDEDVEDTDMDVEPLDDVEP